MEEVRTQLFKNMDVNNAKEDPKLFFKTVKSALLFYAKEKFKGPFAIMRDAKSRDISQVILPPELKTDFTDLEINEAISEQLKSSIENFAKVITEKIPSANLVNFYNNVSTVIEGKQSNEKFDPKTMSIYEYIISRQTVGSVKDAAGTYSPIGNIMSVEDGADYTVLNHELFHLASSIKADEDDSTYFSGFAQSYYTLKDGLIKIGDGINEGYTEYLTRKYFSGTSEATVTYELLSSIACKMEDVIGEDKMQALYLNADLKGLIEAFKEYADEKDVMNFIANTDFLRKHYGSKKIMANNLSILAIDNSLDFLFKCEQKKLAKEYAEGKFEDVDGLFKELVEFCYKFDGVDFSMTREELDGFKKEQGHGARHVVLSKNGKNVCFPVLDKLCEYLASDELEKTVKDTFEEIEKVSHPEEAIAKK